MEFAGNGRKERKWTVYVAVIAFFFLVLVTDTARVRAGGISESEKAISECFERIRRSPVLLRQFLLEMPKGGDLHHHIGGAVYAETFIGLAVKKGLYVEPGTGTLVPPSAAGPDAVPVSRAYVDDTLYERIVAGLSLYNFQPTDETANNHFFSISSRLAMEFTVEDIGDLLTIQRRRAAAENVVYIETAAQPRGPRQALRALAKTMGTDTGDPVSTEKGFLDFREKLIKHPDFKKIIKNSVSEFQKVMAHSDKQLGAGPGSEVKVRFQYYILRVLPALDVLTGVITAFEAAKNSPLVVGINIVAPENHPTARKDYRLHMRMIAAIGREYPGVKRSLHAGELVLGQAVPEALRFHIRDAVVAAGAHRIGHGTDIAYETGARETIKTMREKKIAVEILLTSNELLLGVKGNDHPFPYYVGAGVPVVLAGDDPGMMRTTLTQEFYLAAVRYPAITYTNLKGFALNSIRYSFLAAPTKEGLLEVLNREFRVFEERWQKMAPGL